MSGSLTLYASHHTDVFNDFFSLLLLVRNEYLHVIESQWSEVNFSMVGTGQCLIVLSLIADKPQMLCFLRLSGCMISEEGFVELALALKTNPSHLKELDLSYNNPGESGVKMLSELKEDQQYKLSEVK